MDAEQDFKAFDPKAYLKTFYSGKPENDFGEDGALYAFHRNYHDFRPEGKLLEFGGGPVIYSLISAAIFVDTIHFSDFLQSNIDQVKLWKNGQGHDWSQYFRRVLEFEAKEASNAAIKNREELLRSKIKKFLILDQRFAPQKREDYDVVSVHFVPDSSASNEADFRKYSKNIFKYLKKGGLLFMSVLKESDGYIVQGKKFPAFKLNEQSFERQLKSMGIEVLRIMSQTTYDSKRGIGGYIESVGRKIR